MNILFKKVHHQEGGLFAYLFKYVICKTEVALVCIDIEIDNFCSISSSSKLL